MKTEIYSWRVSIDIKASLEREARLRKMSVAGILDMAAREWLERSTNQQDNGEEQARIHREVSKHIGALEGDDPYRAENARSEIRHKLRQRCGR